ncbi:RNA polymerase sigma-70 factor [Echinicola shivajiensis]|uniref:RNA polymerase sigma-70 factor n=1 Tax=Echinicola shivajiensis TaxID=1035916 RepID=UPI001BFC6284|nr:RNA polymerase sigma-70 factor [Echinicola shivajiensis]
MNDFLLKDIFDQYYTRLVFFAMKYISSQADAEDIVQEAFSKYWIKKSELNANDLDTVKSYLFQTVKNSALNYIKHKKVVENHQVSYNAHGESNDSPLTQLIHTELVAEINEAIAELPTGCKQVAIELFIKGKKYSEVAEALSISVNTVKSQRKRALSILRPRLSDVAFVLLINYYVNINM